VNAPAAPPVADFKTVPAAHKTGFWALAIGSVGVVFGDIGTSPLYAFRLALQQAAHDTVVASSIIGVVSLALWALILVVTVKYVLFMMRADNDGEGGVLSLMALAERAVGRRTNLIFFLGVCGAALFYGDAAITPAISVLSAVEGLATVPVIGPLVTLPVILGVSIVILVALFLIQSRGTGAIATFIGPLMLVWFVTIAALGLFHLPDGPAILAAFSPTYAVGFLATHGLIGFMVLGSVFLTVTGAEALFADMGHFGRWPIQASWLFFVLPCLAINYLGQGAMALAALKVAQAAGQPLGDVDWFFTMAPQMLRVPLVLLAMAATIIASQAVITGAYSLTQQAMQLGFLPRLTILNTSEKHSGQIYLPAVNWVLMVAVIFLVAVFKQSAALGDAYGLAVTGTMVVTTSLAFIVARRQWKWPLWGAAAFIAPLLALDLTFLAANALKIPTGGWLPITIAAALFGVMSTWVIGTELVARKLKEQAVPLADVAPRISQKAHRIAGTAVFLSSTPELTPPALLHNLKHNHVLHADNIILTVRTSREPRIADEDRVEFKRIADNFGVLTLTYGYMEQPNVPKALSLARAHGLKLDILATSFFLGRRTTVRSATSKLSFLQWRIFTFLSRNSSDPTVYFNIPPGRVVELGTQVSI
jgi:KUP system potassium uptake protein